jgi:hypothetical protein
MAYVSQETKAKLSPAIKAVLKKYNMKGTIAVKHHFSLVVNLQSGPIDFDHNDFTSVNVYHIDAHYTGVAKDFLNELLAAMKGPDWFDKSDIQSDYFHVSHYTDINVGKWKSMLVNGTSLMFAQSLRRQRNVSSS